jgi:hypothetical protein
VFAALKKAPDLFEMEAGRQCLPAAPVKELG